MPRIAAILGAPDPEMEMIERILRTAGVPYAYAMRDGRRVHPGNAYEADSLSTSLSHVEGPFAVECGGPGIPSDAVIIDHHHPGDPGYGRPPHKFLRASSIGVLTVHLAVFDMLPESWVRPNSPEVDPGVIDYVDGAWRVGGKSAVYTAPQEVVFAAAADHCLSAAYRGECPGVDPDALMRWRIESRAKFQKRDPAELLAQVEQTRARIRELAVDGIADLSCEPGGTLPEAPEAAAREGVCFIASLTERDGRIKVVCQSGTPEQIEAFMRVWAPAQGLTDIYGDPARGFAGGYLAT